MTLQPLTDLHVLDISDGLSGGYAAKLLGDAGADVIKAVRPDGDNLRWRGNTDQAGGEYPLFTHLHAGHHVEVIAPRDAHDQARLRDLFEWADVVMNGSDTTTSPAFPASHRLFRDCDKPSVYVNISPFGSGGPWSSRAANE